MKKLPFVFNQSRLDWALVLVLLVCGVLGGGLVAPVHANSIEQHYTPAGEKDCLTLVVNEEEGYSQQVCKGYDGIAVFVSDADGRMYVTYRDQVLDRGILFGFHGFNYIGKTMEWRVKSAAGVKTPVATILRWYVTQSGGKERQVLVISKIEDRKSCVAGLVDASLNPNANGLAQKIADGVAQSFQCGERPQWFGLTDDKSPSFN